MHLPIVYIVVNSLFFFTFMHKNFFVDIQYATLSMPFSMTISVTIVTDSGVWAIVQHCTCYRQIQLYRGLSTDHHNLSLNKKT